MKRQTPKQKVLAIYPQAVIAEDELCGKNKYRSLWAEKARFAVGIFENLKPNGINDVWKTTYEKIVICKNWEFLSGWQETKSKAWIDAWDTIQFDMLEKLKQ